MKQISVWPLLYPWPVYLLFYHCLTRCLGNTTTQCCVTSRHCRPSQASSRPWGGNMLCSVSKSWSSAWKPSTGRQALVNTHSKYFGCFHGITTYCKQNWNITERHVQTCPIVCKCETLIYHTLDPRLGCLWRHSDGVCRYQGFNNCLVVVGWSCHMLSFLAMHFFQLSCISLPYFTIFCRSLQRTLNELKEYQKQHDHYLRQQEALDKHKLLQEEQILRNIIHETQMAKEAQLGKMPCT